MERTEQHCRLVTLADFATEYGIPQNTIRSWIRTGQAPRYAKVGHRLYFRREDIDAWLATKFEGHAETLRVASADGADSR